MCIRDRRHPVRFSEEMEDAYCCDLPAPFDPGRFVLPAEKAEYLASEKSLVVRRSETDTNGHTNNTRYVEWAVDDVPDDVYSCLLYTSITFIYGFCIAFFFTPLLNFLEKFIGKHSARLSARPRILRNLTILITYVMFIGCFI